MNVSTRFSKHQKRVIGRAIACSLLLLLPSCRIPFLRHAEPAPNIPSEFTLPPTTTYTSPIASPLSAVVGTFGVATMTTTTTTANSGDSSAKLGIDEFYDDPLLTQLIHQALAGNRELKILDEEIQIARNEILARKGAYLPFVTYGVRAGLDKPSLYTPYGASEVQLLTPQGRNFPDPLGDFLGAFNFSWTPDIWRALHNARDAAAQRYIAATEKRNSFVTQLVADVAEEYYKLMALDRRLDTINQTIKLQEDSLDIAIAKRDAGRGTELSVQRFLADVRKNQSEKLIVNQEIIETENRINFLVNRFPEPVDRSTTGFYDLTIHDLSLGVPAQLLQYRPDIKQAEAELIAAGLDIKVARARFLPAGTITAGIGYQAFTLKYIFQSPDAIIAGVAGELVAPVINKAAIKAEYMSANARQLQAVYNYQKVILNATTEVINRMSMVENYGKSIEVKKLQLAALEASVDVATKLFFNARAEYVEVLLALRDLQEARLVLIDTKNQQLGAIVNTYQALGGGYSSYIQPGYLTQFAGRSGSVFTVRRSVHRALDVVKACLSRAKTLN